MPGVYCVYLCGFQFVADGVFKAELNNFLSRELSEDGYSGVEVRVTPTRTEIIILATRTQNVLGEKGRRIRELTAVVQKRFGFPDGTVEVCTTQWFENISQKIGSAMAWCCDPMNPSLSRVLHLSLSVPIYKTISGSY